MERQVRGGGRRRGFEVGHGRGSSSVYPDYHGSQPAGPEGRAIDVWVDADRTRQRQHMQIRLGRGGTHSGDTSGGGASGSRHGWRLRAVTPRLVRGVEFAPDTQDPDAVEYQDSSSEFIPDTEGDRGTNDLFPYDSDDVQFVPDSEEGAEEEFVPDSFVDNIVHAEDPVGA